jgi:hypothetical protein
MVDVPEKPWQANGSGERRAELDQDATRHDGKPAAEDRKQEAGRRHALARRSGASTKKIPKGERSESEQASSFRLK